MITKNRNGQRRLEACIDEALATVPDSSDAAPTEEQIAFSALSQEEMFSRLQSAKERRAAADDALAAAKESVQQAQRELKDAQKQVAACDDDVKILLRAMGAR